MMNDPISVSFYPILLYAFFEKEEYRKADYSIMAIPVVEFPREGYKIRKVFS